MNQFDFDIQSNGDSALTLLFHASISRSLTKYILTLKKYFSNSKTNKQLIDIIPAYQSLTLLFDSPISKEEIKQVKELAKNILVAENHKDSVQSKTIRIPVCYEERYAPDLLSLAENLKLLPSELIRKHTAKRYLVHMLGFLPGFLYLGGLDEELHFPRKDTAAINIAKGSVGIGGSQTGVYPVSSPGGWHIIGRTPLQMFTIGLKSPAIANPLDEIEFYPISSDEFNKMNQAE